MKKQHGFSLTELMITLAIASILLLIAVPGYQSQIRSTNRGLAAACLTEMSQFMERVYTTSMAYNEFNGTATALPELNCRMDLHDEYTFSLSATATTYTLTAAPQGSQEGDSECSALSINQSGVRTAAGDTSAEKIKSCW
jgi:type IV pilus assembly protein PilE